MPNSNRYSGQKGFFSGMPKGIELKFRTLLNQLQKPLPRASDDEGKKERKKPVVEHVSKVKFKNED